MEVAGLLIAAVFAVLALNAYRENRAYDLRYWARDADRNRILDPAPRQPPVMLSDRLWTTTCSTFYPISPGTDSGHVHAWLRGLEG